MGATSKNSVADIMTDERLRAHWFGGPQVPFWNYDPTQLTIGLEIEYFIAKVDGDDFTLATKQQYLETVACLVRNAGYRDRGLLDQPGRISKDTEAGFVAIKPDFAWHILEISLPPRNSVPELREIIEQTFAEIDAALSIVGLARLEISNLPSAPLKVDLVELDRMDSFTKSVSQRVDRRPFVDPMFPAYIAATHVHLNAFRENELRVWPNLFDIEARAGEMFCLAKEFSGQRVASVRTEFLIQTMGPHYKLKAIPDIIPDSVSAYVAAMNASNHAFPKDRFFPVRDVSYVRPSKYGTVEFRSACSSKSTDFLLEVACWRIVQLVSAYRIAVDAAEMIDSIRNSLEELVATSIVPLELATSIERRLSRLAAYQGRCHE